MLSIPQTREPMRAVAHSSPYADNYAAYIEAGYSPIPELPSSKKPAISRWSDFCEGPPTKEEAEAWVRRWPHAGIALACGWGGLLPLDYDTDNREIIRAVSGVLPRAAVGKMGRKGFTSFYRYLHGTPPTFSFRGKDGKPILELLGHGRKTTIPPSIHPDTRKPYEWVDGKELLNVHFEDLLELPSDIVERLEVALKPWCADKPSWDETERSFEARPGCELSDAERKRHEGHASRSVTGRAADLASMSKDSGRNNALLTAGCYLGKFVAYGLVSKDEVEAALIAACEKNGLLKEDGKRSVLATIRGGLRRAQGDPLPMLAERPYPGAGVIEAAARADNPWGDPEPLVSKIDPMAYPVDALPDAVRAAVEEAQEHIKAPAALIAGCALSAMSAAIQGLVDVERMNGLRGPVSLYLLTIAMSGDRKSRADTCFTAAIRQYDREQEAAYVPILQQYRADLKGWASADEGIQAAIRAAAQGRGGGKGKSLVELENDLRANEAKKPLDAASAPVHSRRRNIGGVNLAL